MLKKLLLPLVLMTIGLKPISAKVILPNVLGENMVLQQKTNAAIWGKAKPGKSVTITVGWSKTKFIGKADAAGNWLIKVKTPGFGGPYNLKITDGEVLEIKNVLIGDVWICSGQSNMEMPLAGWGKVNNYEQEIAAATYPKIRLLQLVHVTSRSPLEDAKVAFGGWKECSPSSIPEFSSTAYFFAREVYQKTGIPIGLIHTSWGGTIAEAWTSSATLKQLPDFVEAVKKIEGTSEKISRANYEEKIKQWDDLSFAKDPGYANGQPVWATAKGNEQWKEMSIPGKIENVENGFNGVFWLTKSIHIPEGWIGKSVKLSLGQVDDNDITWINGVKVGQTTGYSNVRNYPIANNVLKAGLNQITLRIVDTGGDGGLASDPDQLYLINDKNEKIPITGKWSYRLAVALTDLPALPSAYDNPNQVTVLFNAMIHPLLNYTIKGAIWYQGESNADRAYQYRTLFPKMIKDWRDNWKQGDFPFYFVQLANFMAVESVPKPSSWAELREAQFQTLSMPLTGMAVTIDIGDAKDIHPKNKQDVGKRLAYNALSKTYGLNISFSGPMFKSFEVADQKIVITFDHSNGLKTTDGNDLKGFEIAGADQKFYWADAKIVGKQVVVKSDQVTKPVAVRYAWANNPLVNFTNDANLPASPFRTDNWPGITFGNK